MFLSGDEFGNSQQGNNNAYCHDDEISWLDWDDLKKNKDLFSFVKKMIAFRKKHPVVRGRMPASECGLPGTSAHNGTPWDDTFAPETRELGVLFTGFDKKKKADDIVFLCMNMHWEKKDFILPEISQKYKWELEISTAKENKFDKTKNTAEMTGRSVSIFTAVKK